MDRPVLLLALAPDECSEEQLLAVQAAAPDYAVVMTTEAAAITKLVPQIEIAVGEVPRDLLGQMPNLRWFQQWGAGADWLLDHPELQQASFLLTSASGVHAIPISEHIIALLLAFARRLPQAFAAQKRRKWQSPEWEEVFELANKTMLLIGVGAIGARTAEIATALGMAVIGVRRNVQEPVAGISRLYPPDELLEVLPQADFIVITAPLTAETRDMISKAELAAMKPTAILVNIGRGGIIDEPALIAALQAGKLAGAGLDVFAEEPLPADSPLWTLENVIVTAHYSGISPHYDERAVDILLDNLQRYYGGLPMRNLVDKALGY